MITLWRIILAGTRNFLRNAWLSTAATAVMTVTLMIVLASLIIGLALNATIKGVESKIDVSLYLKDSDTADQIHDFQNKLLSLDNVASVKLVTKADALAIYRQQVQGNKKLLDAITEADNPLPASIQVKAKDPRKLDPIVALASQSQYQSLLSLPPSYSGDRKTTIDRIVRVSNFVKTAGLIASLIFMVISILIIFNTIRMAIYTRRSEIEIMKLVGATNWFIRGPFIFEAALYGIIAAVLAVVMVYSLLLVGGPAIARYLGDVNQTLAFFSNSPVLILAGELGVGIFIGVTSSLLAMSRYLKL